jgi:ferredoxin--NADP+ reductase
MNEPTISKPQFVEGRVVSRTQHSDESMSMRVAIAEPLTFTAGQFAMLSVAVDGEPWRHEGRIVERAFSITSSPREPELEFFVELVPHGMLSPKLWALEPGDTLLYRPRASGRFVLDVTSGRKHHMMVATVTGVSPYVSIVRTRAAAEEAGEPGDDRRIAILQGASLSPDLGYRVELEHAAKERAWFTYLPTVSRPHLDPNWMGAGGRAETHLEELLTQLGWGPEDTTIYACGHSGMIQNAKFIYKKRGFPKEAFKQEAYYIAH